MGVDDLERPQSSRAARQVPSFEAWLEGSRRADIAESATAGRSTFLADPADDTASTDAGAAPAKRLAVVEGERSRLGVDSVVDGPTGGGSQADPVTPSASRPLRG